MHHNKYEVWAERNFYYLRRDPNPTPKKERVISLPYMLGILLCVVIIIGGYYA